MEDFSKYEIRVVDENNCDSAENRNYIKEFFVEIMDENTRHRFHNEPDKLYIMLTRKFYPRTYMLATLDRLGNLIGGCIFEWYKGTRSLFLSFVGVKFSYRSHELEEWIFKSSVTAIDKYLNETDRCRPKNIFLESKGDNWELMRYEGWGAYTVPLVFVHPVKIDGVLIYMNSILMTLPKDREEAVVNRRDLKFFFMELFSSKNISNSHMLELMLKEVDSKDTEDTITCVTGLRNKGKKKTL